MHITVVGLLLRCFYQGTGQDTHIPLTTVSSNGGLDGLKERSRNYEELVTASMGNFYRVVLVNDTVL